MCIRDRSSSVDSRDKNKAAENKYVKGYLEKPLEAEMIKSCLLYTSDAADERSSVDLGGRRIIKKKQNCNNLLWQVQIKQNNMRQMTSERQDQKNNKRRSTQR